MFQKVIGQKPETGASSAGTVSHETPPPPSTPAPKPPSSVSPSKQPANHSSSGRNVLSTDVEIKGSIKFSNDLVVDGKIEGSITSDGALTVGENARIKAEISTRSVVIYGKVHGNIEVTDMVELKANAELVGDIKAASLSIEPGAVFVGKSTVGTPSVKAQAQAAATAPAAAKEASSKPSSDHNATSELPLSSKPATDSKAVSS